MILQVEYAGFHGGGGWTIPKLAHLWRDATWNDLLELERTENRNDRKSRIVLSGSLVKDEA